MSEELAPMAAIKANKQKNEPVNLTKTSIVILNVAMNNSQITQKYVPVLFAALFGAFFIRASLAEQSQISDSALDKPNFIVIYTDDQGYGDIGIFGAKGFDTPNLDNMAKQGIKFTDFYVAASTCTPSRAALMTGSYPKRIDLHKGVLNPFSKFGLNPKETTIPEILSKADYQSAMIGKWHLGHHPEFMPNAQGFHYFFGVPYSHDMHAYHYKSLNKTSPPLPLFQNEKIIENGPNPKTLTKRYTYEAVKYIEKNHKSPFFLYIAHNMPHLPWHVSSDFSGMSDYGLYGDVIEELDWSLGQIMAALKRHGIYDNTLVIFTSDNGPSDSKPNGGSTGPLRGSKGTTWEGGFRVPAIAIWPNRIPPGKVYKGIVSTLDILPTFARLAGADIGIGEIDGHDISSILLSPEQTPSPYRAFYFYAADGELEAIRVGNWKLHTRKTRGWHRDISSFKFFFPTSLFDLSSDLSEAHNSVSNQMERVRRMKKMMRDFDTQLERNIRTRAYTR